MQQDPFVILTERCSSSEAGAQLCHAADDLQFRVFRRTAGKVKRFAGGIHGEKDKGSGMFQIFS